MSRILKAEPEIEISNSRKIVDARNKIIHGYDEISDDVIWGIVVNHLPTLKKEVIDLPSKQHISQPGLIVMTPIRYPGARLQRVTLSLKLPQQ